MRGSPGLWSDAKSRARSIVVINTPPPRWGRAGWGWVTRPAPPCVEPHPTQPSPSRGGLFSLQRSVHEPRYDVAIASRHLHLAAALQHQEAFAVGVRLDLADLVEIDDARAVDALEAARIEPFLEILHRLAQDQGVVAGIDA